MWNIQIQMPVIFLIGRKNETTILLNIVSNVRARDTTEVAVYF